MPVHFSVPEDEYIEATMVAEKRRLLMRDLFDLPDLYAMDDAIANGTFEPEPGEPRPPALFNAPRVDYSLHRLRHLHGDGTRALPEFRTVHQLSILYR